MIARVAPTLAEVRWPWSALEETGGARGAVECGENRRFLGIWARDREDEQAAIPPRIPQTYGSKSLGYIHRRSHGSR
jgi:hypothetical protein